MTSSLDQPAAILGAKICGVRAPEHAAFAASHGATHIGMIFAPSRRQIDAGLAASIVAAVRGTGPATKTVGVFVDATPHEINDVIAATGIDLVQLSGEEHPDLLERLHRPTIKALRPVPGESVGDVRRRVALWLEARVLPIAFLVDGYHPQAHGGTGVRADWDLVASLVDWSPIPVILAGGLTPDNVADAIRQAAPAMVDTSSGVEIDGRKDLERIRAFLDAAAAGFQARSEASA